MSLVAYSGALVAPSIRVNLPYSYSLPLQSASGAGVVPRMRMILRQVLRWIDRILGNLNTGIIASVVVVRSRTLDGLNAAARLRRKNAPEICA